MDDVERFISEEKNLTLIFGRSREEGKLERKMDLLFEVILVFKDTHLGF